ncbi:peptidase S24 [Flavobacterium sp. LS1R47]|jgi:phage repressor protein C with HTH and peptisase S24 domain|uniref:Peptidase S24 n=1 Tax=Flavobacterium frigoritolerans TaxID=2987686 RepID=A0A9X2ZK06_9FLAO|nr:S24 family peptidase [Flavobacterium frigoritolerans]MCV9932514.1 peptidase S24 [Flavobacterium frigoritolerans]
MIVDRILQFIEYKGINKRKFYIETGLSNGFLDKVKDIGASKIEHILNAYPEICTEWLLTGNGDMLLKSHKFGGQLNIKIDSVHEPNTTSYKPENKESIQKQQIPLYNIQAPGGIASLFQDANQDPIEFISIPYLPKCDGAIHVNGDSMHPLLKSGDIVMYKRMNNVIENIFWGEMYLVYLITDDLEEFVMIKWIQKSDKGDDWIKLVSENPQHQPKEVLFTNIKGLALVKVSIRINATY